MGLTLSTSLHRYETSSDVVLALLLTVVIPILDVLIRQLSLMIVLISSIVFTQVPSPFGYRCECIWPLGVSVYAKYSLLF